MTYCFIMIALVGDVVATTECVTPPLPGMNAGLTVPGCPDYCDRAAGGGQNHMQPVPQRRLQAPVMDSLTCTGHSCMPASWPHLGAAADDAADFKQRLGDCFSESKAAATRLATERDQRQGVRARVHLEMRQLKRALQELKEVDFSESGDVLAKVYAIEFVGYDGTDGQPDFCAIATYTKDIIAGRAGGLLIKTDQPEPPRASRITRRSRRRQERLRSPSVATAHLLYTLAGHALLPIVHSSLNVPTHKWTASNSLASLHISIAEHAWVNGHLRPTGGEAAGGEDAGGEDAGGEDAMDDDQAAPDAAAAPQAQS
eukprot:XP_001703608.1 predicted protein [Chlamydomonas reinhardtii]